ncbi:MAG: hypothetical protein ACRDZ9_03115 [Acidimicrobiales bacterium]
MHVLVGGVGQLYQGDLDLGRVAVERLGQEMPEAGAGVEVAVEELHYGAVAVAQRLEDLRPDALVVVGAAARDRPPGTVERRRVRPRAPGPGAAPSEAQAAVGDAVTGYVTIDLLVEVGQALGALPARTVAIEVEPATTYPAESLSPVAAAGLDRALELVVAEVRRVPVLDLADTLRSRLRDGGQEPSPALRTMATLLGHLAVLDEEGRWSGAFSARDRLRLQMAGGETGEGMEALDWALWWGLIEELDRLEARESLAP